MICTQQLLFSLCGGLVGYYCAVYIAEGKWRHIWRICFVYLVVLIMGMIIN